MANRVILGGSLIGPRGPQGLPGAEGLPTGEAIAEHLLLPGPAKEALDPAVADALANPASDSRTTLDGLIASAVAGGDNSLLANNADGTYLFNGYYEVDQYGVPSFEALLGDWDRYTWFRLDENGDFDVVRGQKVVTPPVDSLGDLATNYATLGAIAAAYPTLGNIHSQIGA